MKVSSMSCMSIIQVVFSISIEKLLPERHFYVSVISGSYNKVLVALRMVALIL